MDGSKTAPFSLAPPKSEMTGSVLVLHGFTGSPWEVRPLAESLHARGYHVHAPLLPGHGGEGDEMAGVGWRDWERAALEGLESLPPHPRTFVAGLSMGALLSLLLAARRPATVKGLALMAPAYRLKPLSARALRVLRALPAKVLPNRWVSKRQSDLEDEAARADNPVMHRYPAARLNDLFMLQDLTRMVVAQVKTPALLVAAMKDHVVDFRGVQTLHRALPQSKLVTLQRGYHVVTRDTDRARVATEVGQFFDQLVTS